jgi:biotin synthesis protein BioG
MQTFLKNNNSDELILFFDGWGMDERPYRMMKSKRDILFVNDYSDLNFEFDFSKYKKIFLLTFSAGVFMAAYLKDKLPNFDMKIAVNGVLKPLDEKLGIPQSSFEQMESITLENAMDFRKKLIVDETQLDKFNRNQPFRDLKSSLDELSALKKYFKTDVDFEFDKVFIGMDDKIIPIENQKRAWALNKNCNIISGGHFLFYNFENFDEIIDY